LLPDETMVDFHVLANEADGFNNKRLAPFGTFLHEIEFGLPTSYSEHYLIVQNNVFPRLFHTIS